MPHDLSAGHDDAGRGDLGLEFFEGQGVDIVATCRDMAGRVGHVVSVSVRAMGSDVIPTTERVRREPSDAVNRDRSDGS
jgi:hypothetical protein